ncbi:salicylate 1-monooxygenase [Blastococcus sp. KM273128]|nr:salicylate 1-monooxygenase [Blastococcus sp. KM273128]
MVGAGIAGLTVANTLIASGADCHVFEQAGQFADVGAGIQVAPNAARVLHRLGLGPSLDAVAVRPRRIEMRRWDDGAVLRSTDLEPCAELFGAPYYTVHRADLHRVLVEHLPCGVVHLGRRCVGAVEGPDGVALRHSDGSTTTVDVGIGADGIRSVLRRLVADDEPTFSGQHIVRGLVPGTAVPELAADPRVQLWLGPGQHLVCYPVRGGRLISFGATIPASTAGDESWTAPGSASELRARYWDWHPVVDRILAAAEEVTRWALHDREVLHRWSTARTTLVGDAAHPMLPFLAQGANQAIEDAMVLARGLRGIATGEVAPALLGYEELRRARTEEVHRTSRRNTQMLHLPDGPEQRERDAVLGRTADVRTQAWLFGHDVTEGWTAEASIAG